MKHAEAVCEMHPRKRNGDLLVYFTDITTGLTYADTKTVKDCSGNTLHRSGPEHPNHHHRPEDYGLADGILRCKHCGLLVKNATVASSGE